jgi:NAD(P)-dependent dehydrogenase (short-subunit alcohol dehydrogenase family)
MEEAIKANLAGKTAVVTGATGGIGKEIARGLAKLGATVIIGARNAERGEAARAEIARDAGHENVHVLAVDVAEARSMRAFAAELERRFPRLDILVNNAGVWLTDRRTTADGHELTLGTNVIGPHLLTSLLLPRLKASAPARVVNIVSAFAGNYDVTDLQFSRRKFDGFKAYGQSKQALRMLTWGLATRLAGTGVTANAASPGFVKTDFNQNAHGFTATMIGLSSKLFAVSPAKGADTPIWVAAAAEVEGVTGKYFEARKEKDGKFREPEAIAELERKLDQLTTAGTATAVPAHAG